MERCKPGINIQDCSVIPTELAEFIEETPVGIVCLGEQRPYDMVPKSTTSSHNGKANIGRMFSDHGTTIFV